MTATQPPKTHLFHKLRWLCLAALATGSAQAADVDLTQPVRKVEARTPARFADGTPERQVAFTLWQSDLQVDDVVGRIDSGVFCSGGKPFQYTKRLDDWLVTQLSRTFKARAVELGLSAPGDTKSVFDDKGGNAADFKLGATLLSLDYRTCGDNNVKGDVYAKVKWEVFSARRQKVVYTGIIESGHSSASRIDAKEFDQAFIRAIVDNLLGDPKFVEVIQSGGTVEDKPAKTLAPLTLMPGRVVATGVAQAAAELREAVATVESGIGSGSAFYISQEGYLLTNSHVVADAKFVRVRLAGGRSVVGEVLRVDKARDVALLRTDPVPAPVLALRRAAATVGEEVHAIGSPYGEALSGTLTRGVLSARRVLEGVAYLQSDVAINPGNSGGPLIDANGRVLGIAQVGTSAKGISLFIPIEEALDKLALTLGEAGAPETGQAAPARAR